MTMYMMLSLSLCVCVPRRGTDDNLLDVVSFSVCVCPGEGPLTMYMMLSLSLCVCAQERDC